jgi:molecular chaperone GrpE
MNTDKPEVEVVVEPKEAHQNVADVADEATAEAKGAEGTAKSAEGREGETEPPRAPPPDYRELRIQTLERTLAEREATLHSYIRAHKKAEADFEAFRQRLERDRDRELVASRAKLVERLLDVDDNLERTLDAAKRGGQDALAALVQGVEMVHRQFVERLTELGLERVTPTGKPFDPTSMEALGVVPVSDSSQHDTVVMTLRAGYRLGDREIRPALVQVGKCLS